MSDQDITLYHNPACATSRNVLGLIEAAGHRPVVVEYLKTGWSKPHLKGLLARMGASPRDILRVRGTPAVELGLTAPGVSDEAILDAMVAHPILVERPIVDGPKGAALCRPKETVEGLI
ncbi:MAG: arsC [Caulobacteraceae bacterium]|nr:arsC [Caulobacteraceae bacterium]